MPGIGELNLSCNGVQDGTQTGHEHTLGDIRFEQIINPPQDFPRGGDLPGNRAQQADRRRHHHGGRNALICDIPDEQAKPAVIELEKVVEVAADLPGRLVIGTHLPVSQVGQFLREQRILDHAGDAHLIFEALASQRLGLLLSNELRYP